jgi:hypothetical protein
MTVLLSLLAFTTPVVLEVSAPAQVFSGEQVPVVVRAKNVSNLPVTIVTASPPNVRLGLKWRTELIYDGKPLVRDERSGWIAQWVFGSKICPDQFVVIQPGQSAEIYRDKFSVIFQEDRRRERKDDDARAPREALAPGEYTFRAHFGFAREFKDSKSALAPKMEGLARQRYVRTWVGAVDAETTFKVLQKAMAAAE